MKILKCGREVIDFMNYLSANETRVIYRMLRSDLDTLKRARKEGLVIKLTRSRKIGRSYSVSVNDAGEMEVIFPVRRL